MIKQNIDKTKFRFETGHFKESPQKKITKAEAAKLLGCKVQTIYNYLNRITKGGLNALKDNRHSNKYKLTSGELSKVISFKERNSSQLLTQSQH